MDERALLEAIGQMMDEKLDQKLQPIIERLATWRNPTRKAAAE
jgi:hypothetical protein